MVWSHMVLDRVLTTSDRRHFALTRQLQPHGRCLSFIEGYGTYALSIYNIEY